MKRILVVGLALGAALKLAATSYTWCGNGGDGEWTNPANWLKDGKTVVEAGYPGVNATGGLSAGDGATFLADAEATVTLRDKLTIGTLDLSKGGTKLTLVGGENGTNNMLTVSGTLNFSGTGTELTLDNFGLYRAYLGTLGASGKLSLVNSSYLFVNGITMNVGSSVSLAGGSTLYLNGAISPVANGNNSISLAGGSYLHVQSASTLTAGFSLSLADASRMYVNGKFTTTLMSSMTLSGKSLLTVVGEYYVGNPGQTVVIDDSTVDAKSHCWLCGNSPGGGIIRFQGANPRLVVRGTAIRCVSNNANMTVPMVFDYVVPEGGFVEPPFQHLQTSSYSFADHWNPKATAKFTVNPNSPAVTAGTATEQCLMLSTRGIVCNSTVYRYADLSDTTAALRVTDGTPDGAGNVVVNTYSTQRTIWASIGSGTAAASPARTTKIDSVGSYLAVTRKTLSYDAAVLSVSTSAAKTEARLLVGESADALEVVATREVSAPGMYNLSWTAPEAALEKATAAFAARFREFEAAKKARG